MRLWNRPGMPAVGYSSARRVAPLPTHPPQTPPHHCEPHRCAPILHRQTTPMDEFETPAPTAEGGDDMGFGADMGASEPLPTFGEAEEPLPTFGESEPLPTFGDAEEAAPMGGMDMGGGDMGGMGGDMGGMGGGMGGGEPAVMSDPDPPPGVFWRRPMEPTRGPTRCPPALPAPPRPCPRLLSLRQTLARLPPSRVSAHLSLSRPPPSLPPSRLARTTSESAHLVPLGPAGLRASP